MNQIFELNLRNLRLDLAASLKEIPLASVF